MKKPTFCPLKKIKSSFGAAFESAWQENQLLSSLQNIAKHHMSIDDLPQHAELKAALLAAYRLGKNNR
ncbi:MAG: hypothetical protein OQL06_01035 [Gammaproteobacteria bacterium]|nr:hypothetical protein [Gammaproteobacteria bacterium]